VAAVGEAEVVAAVGEAEVVAAVGEAEVVAAVGEAEVAAETATAKTEDEDEPSKRRRRGRRGGRRRRRNPGTDSAATADATDGTFPDAIQLPGPQTPPATAGTGEAPPESDATPTKPAPRRQTRKPETKTAEDAVAPKVTLPEAPPLPGLAAGGEADQATIINVETSQPRSSITSARKGWWKRLTE